MVRTKHTAFLFFPPIFKIDLIDLMNVELLNESVAGGGCSDPPPWPGAGGLECGGDVSQQLPVQMELPPRYRAGARWHRGWCAETPQSFL